MNYTIFKYKLDITSGLAFTRIDLPKDAMVLHTAIQKTNNVYSVEETLFIWVHLDPEAKKITREFAVVGTGRGAPPLTDAKYLGTVHMLDGSLVLHVFERITLEPIGEDTASYIIATKLGSGWAAVCMWWNKDGPNGQGFWEPYQTGHGRYKTREEAVQEAKIWAEADQIEYREEMK